MRKYIAYARKYCCPILDDGAKQVIQDFYLQLRKRKNYMDSTPVTTRQLEALIRLAVAPHSSQPPQPSTPPLPVIPWASLHWFS